MLHPVYGVPIRRFESGPLEVLLRNTLEPAGHKLDFMPGRNSKKPWRLDGKQLQMDEVIALADTLRKARGLTPIAVEH